MSQARVTMQPDAYADSVRLMQASLLVGSADGVKAALVAMAAQINLDLALDMGLSGCSGSSPNGRHASATAPPVRLRRLAPLRPLRLVRPGYPGLMAAAEEVVRVLGFQTPQRLGRVPAPARGPASAPRAFRGPSTPAR